MAQAFCFNVQAMSGLWCKKGTFMLLQLYTCTEVSFCVDVFSLETESIINIHFIHQIYILYYPIVLKYISKWEHYVSCTEQLLVIVIDTATS